MTDYLIWYLEVLGLAIIGAAAGILLEKVASRFIASLKWRER
jgi:hypothetical protein